MAIPSGFPFNPSVVALAALAACCSAQSQDSALAQQTTPESSITVGAGAVGGAQRDRALIGQYNGLRPNSAYGQLELDIQQRDDASGTWTTLQGRDLGLNDRDLSISREQQGAWKLSADYSELVRHDPRSVNTGMLGAGTTTPTVVRLATPGSGAELNFQMKRVGLGLAGSMWINPQLQLDISFKTEDKTGERRFGRGYDCAAYVCSGTQSATSQKFALLMMAEPVDATTRQIESRLNFSGDKVSLSAGYYGSFFSNANGSMAATVPGSLNNPSGGLAALFGATPAGAITAAGTSLQNVLGLPTALAPDNQAHQLYLQGHYAWTPTTRSTFKYAYTHATQNQDFSSMGLANAPAGVSNLGGVVDTTLVQLGLTARPAPMLSLLGNLRYESRDDRTPLAYYNVEGATLASAVSAASPNLPVWTNANGETRKMVGKLEASYRLPDGYRATLGADYESMDRGHFTPTDNLNGLSAVRDKTTENGYRLELRRAMSETFNASLGVGRSSRSGSDWLSFYSINNGVAGTGAATATATLPNTGVIDSACIISQVTPANLGTCPVTRTNIYPYTMMDRTRDKVKLSGDWSPVESLSLQLMLEDGKDRYSGPTEKGLSATASTLYSADASYAMSEAWKLSGYWSSGIQHLKVAQGNLGYLADIKASNSTVGFGLLGKPSARLELGLSLSRGNDVTRYGLAVDPGTPPLTAANLTTLAFNNAQAALGLPDVKFRVDNIKLFARYEVDKNAALRLSLSRQSLTLDEWSWGYDGKPFVYSDNTTVNMNQRQSVNLLGVSYIYRF